MLVLNVLLIIIQMNEHFITVFKHGKLLTILAVKITV